MEVISLDFTMRDKFVTGEVLVTAKVPKCFSTRKEGPFSYWAWSKNSYRYFARSGLARHVELGYLAKPTIQKLERLLENKNSFHGFGEIKKKRKRNRGQKNPDRIYTAKFTEDSVQAWEDQYASLDGMMIATQFLNGLRVKKAREYVRVDETRVRRMVAFLAENMGIPTTEHKGHPCYTKAQQDRILLKIGADYNPRPSCHTRGVSNVGTNHRLPIDI